mgnify:CR=1 FL=1
MFFFERRTNLHQLAQRSSLPDGGRGARSRQELSRSVGPFVKILRCLSLSYTAPKMSSEYLLSRKSDVYAWVVRLTLLNSG